MYNLKRILSAVIIICLIIGYLSTIASAERIDEGAVRDRGYADYINSIGSDVSDYVNNSKPSGYDQTQGIESAYKNAYVGDNNTVINSIEETDVYVTIAPIFSVKVPKTIILNSIGSGIYDIGIKGDMTGMQRLTVKPIDKIEDDDDINFYMSEQNAHLGAKGDIIATIEQTKINWTHSEVDIENFTYLENAATISASGISAGSWAGTFDFKIGMEIFKTSGSGYFALFSPEINEVLMGQPTNVTTIETLVDFTFRQSDIELIHTLVNNENISYYSAVGLIFYMIYEETEALNAAKISDAAFDMYLKNTLFTNRGYLTHISVDNCTKGIYGYSITEIADYIENGTEYPNVLKPAVGSVFEDTVAYSITMTGIKNYANTNAISTYSSILLFAFMLEENANAIAAAAESESTLNAYLVDNIYDEREIEHNITMDEYYETYFGYTIHEMAAFLDTGTLPVRNLENIANPWDGYTGNVYLMLSNMHEGELPTELVLPTELFGYQITGIYRAAFYDEEIDYIYVPSTYTDFSLSPFRNCKAKEIVIRDGGVTSLPSDLFENNTYIEIITLPSSLTSPMSFNGCTNLKQVINAP